jgi:ketosteroid isomerase-like protein
MNLSPIQRNVAPDLGGLSCRLPWLGLYRGREAVKEFLAHMHRNLAVTAFGRRGAISEGDKAAAFGWFRQHALPTGSTTDISYSVLFELR